MLFQDAELTLVNPKINGERISQSPAAISMPLVVLSKVYLSEIYLSVVYLSALLATKITPLRTRYFSLSA